MEMDRQLQQAALKGDVSFLEKEVASRVKEGGGDFEYFLSLTRVYSDQSRVNFLEFIRTRGRNKENILHLGMRLEKYEWVKETVKLLPKDVIEKLMLQKDSFGDTPLNDALYFGSKQFIKETVKLFSKEVINKVICLGNNNGTTPLHRAVRVGNMDILELLYDQCEGDKEKLWMVKEHNGNTPLHVATGWRRVDVVKFLVGKHPGLARCVNNLGNTPLHVAAEQGKIEIVRFLMEKLPDLARVRNKDGHTLLDDLCNRAKFEDALYIVSQQPDLAGDMVSILNSPNNTSRDTPLHLAAICGNFNAAKIFLQHHPDLAIARNKLQETPLHLAIKHDADVIIDDDKPMEDEDIPKMIKLLIEKESGMACLPDEEGLTPLHRATSLCASYNLRVVMFILDKCPESAKVRDGSENTILHLLVDRIISYEEGLKFLRKPEINTMRDMKNKHGETPLDLAWKYNIKMVRALLNSSSTSSLVQQQIEFQMLEKQKLTMKEYGVIERASVIRKRLQISGTNFLLSQDSNGRNILHKLMYISPSATITSENYVKFIEEILVRNPILVTEIDLNGDTPIHILVKNPPSTQFRLDDKNCDKNPPSTQIRLDDNNCKFRSMEASGILAKLLDLCNKYYYKAIAASAEGSHYYEPPWLIPNVKGNTPLHEALIINGDTTLVRKLLKLDIKITAKLVNKNEETPLHILAQRPTEFEQLNDKDIRVLLDANEEATWMLDHNGLYPLERAINVGNLTTIKIIYEAHSDALFMDNKEGRTIWHKFIDHSTYLTTRLLKDYQNNPNFKKLMCRKDKDEKTPLHLAIERQQLEHVMLILNSSLVSVELLTAKNKEEKTALHLLIDSLNLDNRHIDLIKQFLDVAKREEIGAKCLKEQDNEGRTPLHLAIKHQHLEHVKLILASSLVSIDELMTTKDKEGQTPLHLLIDSPNEHIDLIKQYLDVEKREEIGGKWLKEQDNQGRTPLHLAINNRHFKLIQFFLEKYLGKETMKESLELPDKSGVTPSDLLRSLPIEIPDELEHFLKRQPTMVGIRSVWDVPTEQMQEYTNTMGVIAALLVTITFTAAFTVPGGSHSDNTNPPGKVSNTGTPLLLKRVAFHVFMVFDILSMCLSTLVLFCLLWVVATSDEGKSVVLMDFSILLLLLSFYTTLITFMAGLFATVFPIKQWLAIFTLVLCSLLMAMMNKYLVMNHMVPFAKGLLVLWQRIEKPKKLKDDIVKYWCEWKSSGDQQQNPSPTSAKSTSHQNNAINETGALCSLSPGKFLHGIVRFCSKMKPSQDQQAAAHQTHTQV